MTTAYPYDPTGTNPECLIEKDESYLLSTYYNKWRCIIPIAAPFYRKDLIVIHKETQRELIEGVDYHLGHRFVEATAVNQQMIYGSIFIDDLSLTGSIVFKSYRTLGGIYNVTHNRIMEYLATEFDDPRNCKWEEVLKHVIVVPPLHIPKDLEDAIKTDLVTGALNDIDIAIGQSHIKLTEAYNSFNAKLTSLEAQVDAWEVTSHSDKVNAPHVELHSQIGTLGISESAADALKVYNKTLVELADMINEMSITQKDLDSYALKAGFTMEGPLLLQNGLAKVVNSTSVSTVDLSDGSVSIATNGEFQINANVGDVAGDLTSNLVSGNNLLTLQSSADEATYKSLIYNGTVVITEAYVNDYVPVIDPSLLNITAVDNAFTQIRGNGSKDSPLSVSVKFVVSDGSNDGLIKLTDDDSCVDINVGASASLLHSLNILAEETVPLDRKVNLHFLRDNPILTKADLGLSNVDNLADVNYTLSDAFKTAVLNKAVIGHKHPVTDFQDLPDATESVKGKFRLSNDKQFTVIDAAAMSSLAGDIITNSHESDKNLNEAMPSEALTVVFWGTAKTYTNALTVVNNVLTVPQKIYYCRGNEYICPEFTYTAGAGITYYLHAELGVSSNSVSYHVERSRLADTDYKTYLGSFTNTSFNIPNVVRRLSVSSEMRSHFNDKNAHGFNSITKESIGLGNVTNRGRTYGPRYGMSRTSNSGVGPVHAILNGCTKITIYVFHGTNAWQTIRKVIVPKTNRIDLYLQVDDYHEVWINGGYRNSGSGWERLFHYAYSCTPGVPLQFGLIIGNWDEWTHGGYHFIDGNRHYRSNTSSWGCLNAGINGKGVAQNQCRDIYNVNNYATPQFLASYQFQQVDGPIDTTPSFRAIPDNSGIISGTIALGSILPVPLGYVREDCVYMTTVVKVDPSIINKVPNITSYVDEDGRVTCNGLPIDIDQSLITIKYMCIVNDN